MKRLIYGRPHLRTLKFKQLRTGKQAQRSFHAAFRTSSASSSWRKRSKNLSGTPPSASLLPRTTLRCLSPSPWERGLDLRNARQMGRFRCILDASAILRLFLHVCTRCLHPLLGFRVREILCIRQRPSSVFPFTSDPFVSDGCFEVKRLFPFPLFLVALYLYFLEALMMMMMIIVEFDSIKDWSTSCSWKSERKSGWFRIRIRDGKGNSSIGNRFATIDG